MVDPVEQYCNDVLAGKIVAGKKIKQACKRHLNDLKKQRTKEFPYYYDPVETQKAIALIELLPKHDGGVLKMLPFQKFIIGSLYGWREVGTGYRRFRQAYISMSRKNGKTYLASGMAVNTLIGERLPERNRSIMFVANSAQQSRLGFDMMSDELAQASKKSSYIRKRVKIQKQAITDRESASKAVALASNTQSLDGMAGTLIIYDEYHAAKTRDVYNVMKSGQAQEPNALLAIISTAGVSPNVPMNDDYKRLSKVLTGKEKADRYFMAVWELDNKKEIYDQSKWEKANPIFADPLQRKVMTESIQGDVDEALEIGNIAPVLVKSFNMWQNASTNSYLSIADWQLGTLKDTPDINGRDCYVGLDLSRSNDLTAVSWLIPTGNEKFYVDAYAFVATHYGIRNKIKTDGVDYIALARKNECELTNLEDGTIDYRRVAEYIREYVGEHDLVVKGVCYDPYRMQVIEQDLLDQGLPLIKINQWPKILSAPTLMFKDQLLKGNIVHPDNKLLEYNVNNAVMKFDSNNNVILDKTKNSNKIDEVASIINTFVAGYDYYTKQERSKKLNEYYESGNFSF